MNTVKINYLIILPLTLIFLFDISIPNFLYLAKVLSPNFHSFGILDFNFALSKRLFSSFKIITNGPQT